MKHICIDFEGVGKSRNSEVSPFPTMLGALVPSERGRPRYHAWFFDDAFAPICRSTSCVGRKEVIDFHTLGRQLFRLTDETGCGLVHYSSHEARVFKDHLDPGTWQEVRQKLLNIKPLAVKVRNRRGHTSESNDLSSVMNRLRPGRSFPPQPTRGAAQTCRDLLATGHRFSRWRNWPEARKVQAAQLLEYNKGDCDSVYRLVNIVHNHLGEDWVSSPRVQAIS